MSQRPSNYVNLKKKGMNNKFTSNYGNPSPSVKSTKYGNNIPEGKPQKRSILQQIQQNFHEADEKGVLENWNLRRDDYSSEKNQNEKTSLQHMLNF